MTRCRRNCRKSTRAIKIHLSPAPNPANRRETGTCLIIERNLFDGRYRRRAPIGLITEPLIFPSRARRVIFSSENKSLFLSPRHARRAIRERERESNSVDIPGTRNLKIRYYSNVAKVCRANNHVDSENAPLSPGMY